MLVAYYIGLYEQFIREHEHGELRELVIGEIQACAAKPGPRKWTGSVQHAAHARIPAELANSGIDSWLRLALGLT
jgi:hypothetical protein